MTARTRALAALLAALASAPLAWGQAAPAKLAPGAAKAAARPAPEPPSGELADVFSSGTAALKAGRLEEAEEAFRRVIAAGAGVAPVHNNLGFALRERGEHEKAVMEFREAIRLDGSYIAPRVLLGASLLALGRTADAQAALRKAVALAPDLPLARLQLAQAEQAAGDWAAAVEQYRALAKVDPANADFRYGLGTSYLRLSEECLRELQRTAPESARVQQAQGHGLRLQGRPDEALRAFAKAAEADPSLPEIHLAMAQIHMEQNRFADARREAQAEMRVVPESAGARALLQRLDQLEAGKR
jgi:protein O-GlcNAc transferase